MNDAVDKIQRAYSSRLVTHCSDVDSALALYTVVNQ